MQEEDFVSAAQAAFPGSTIVGSTTYEAWRAGFLQTLKDLFKPSDLVTHLRCAGAGCPGCQGTGRDCLGDDPPEEHRLELATRLALLSRYSCPPERQAWLDQVVDTLCRRWTIVAGTNRPNF